MGKSYSENFGNTFVKAKNHGWLLSNLIHTGLSTPQGLQHLSQSTFLAHTEQSLHAEIQVRILPWQGMLWHCLCTGELSRAHGLGVGSCFLTHWGFLPPIIQQGKEQNEREKKIKTKKPSWGRSNLLELHQWLRNTREHSWLSPVSISHLPCGAGDAPSQTSPGSFPAPQRRQQHQGRGQAVGAHLRGLCASSCPHPRGLGWPHVPFRTTWNLETDPRLVT